MMNKKFIKGQMQDMGINANKLKDITGLGYATISSFLNKDEYNIKADSYLNIINELFTPFEQMVYANAVNKARYSKNNVEYWYNELLTRKVADAFESGKIDIQKSGSPYSDEDGVVRMVPAHLIVTFKDPEGKNEIRIFDGEAYRDSSKQNAVKKHFGLK